MVSGFQTNMANIPTQNNNPGDIKDPATGTFNKYSDPKEGMGALLNDLQAKFDGKLGQNGTLADFGKMYAPPSDNNNTAQYVANLANKLGVRPDTPFSQLRPKIGQLADAISQNEGFSPPKTDSSNLPGVGALGTAVQDSFQAPPGSSTAEAPQPPPDTMNATGSQVIPQSGGILQNLKKNIGSIPGQLGSVANKVANTVAPNEVDTLSSALAGIVNPEAQAKGFISTPTISGQAKGLGELGKVALAATGVDAGAEAAPSLASKAKSGINAVEGVMKQHPVKSAIAAYVISNLLKNTKIGNALEQATGIKGILDLL